MEKWTIYYCIQQTVKELGIKDIKIIDDGINHFPTLIIKTALTEYVIEKRIQKKLKDVTLDEVTWIDPDFEECYKIRPRFFIIGGTFDGNITVRDLKIMLEYYDQDLPIIIEEDMYLSHINTMYEKEIEGEKFLIVSH